MKKLIASVLLSLALLAPSQAQNEVGEAVYTECARQMALGSCGALVDPGSLTTEWLQRTFPVVVDGKIVRVKNASFIAVRGLGGEINPKDLRMCERARDFCKVGANSEECIVARSLWSKPQ